MGWKNYFTKQDEAWTSWGEASSEAIMTVANFSSEVMGQIDAIAQQRHQNKMQTLDNEYNADIAALEGQGLSEKEFADKKAIIDKNYQTKKKDLEIKAAKREKKMAIFQDGVCWNYGCYADCRNIFSADTNGKWCFGFFTYKRNRW